MNFSLPDLTIHPPRSARAQLGGICALPRLIDKCRATLAGKNGEYHFNCPLDQRVLSSAANRWLRGIKCLDRAKYY